MCATAERLRGALRGYYRWYRETQPMAENMQRDRTLVPALDSLMRRTADARADRLADVLAEGLGAGAAQRALIRLALDFWTWRRLAHEALDDDAAADLMTSAATSAAGYSGSVVEAPPGSSDLR
jgi:hypothetical protein